MKISSRYIQRHLTMPVRDNYKGLSKAIKCFDGTKVSVQGSAGHYCSPKSNFGPYSSVEVWYPDAEEVSGWVPVAQIVEYVNSHGGVK